MTDIIPPGNQALAQVAMKDDPASPNSKMTEKQAAELRDLCETLDEPFDGNLTAEQADERIAALKSQID